MIKSIVSLSGGLDSAVTLKYAKIYSDEVLAIGFHYGSKHNRYENEAAANIAEHYHVPYRLISLPFIEELFKSDLLKTGGEIPEGHYESESMKRTVVPCRNLIFTSILAGIAETEGASYIYLGVHAGDHAIYPDCRIDFLNAAKLTIERATEGRVLVVTPWESDSKRVIVRRGLNLGVPFHLTRTCYKDQPIACGVCGSCHERLEAFAECGVKDPIPYESRDSSTSTPSHG